MQSDTNTIKKKRRKYYKDLTCSLDLSRDDKDVLEYISNLYRLSIDPIIEVIAAGDLAEPPSINLNSNAGMGDLWLILV